jgi:two-component system response regulator GlrR
MTSAVAPGSAELYVLHNDSGAPDELTRFLQARPKHIPLIVIGHNPTRDAAPTLWLPAVPSAALLSPLIDSLMSSVKQPTTSTTRSWRRKSDMILGNSPSIRQLLHSLDQLAPARTAVIITGESGVGKELVAQALHFCSPRAAAPFIAINCAAIAENLFETELFGHERGAFTGATNTHVGAFEAADNGTLFLDEIGDMPLNMQAKLLRTLETNEVQRVGSTTRKKINFRLVTATNRTLEAEVRAERFREDLYYRVHVYPLHIKPLRERPEDIPPIVTHHLSVIAIREKRPTLRLTADALEKLVSYSWPGNVRELVNVIERSALVAGSDVIAEDHIDLPDPSKSRLKAPSLVPYRDAKVQFEHEYYSRLMTVAAGNISLAAKLGEKTRKEVYDALKRLGLDATAYRAQDEPADEPS